MGNGVVLESGTHQELLADVNGPYSRLVQAQKLRGGAGREDPDEEDEKETETAEARDIEKEAEEEIPLGRSDTRRSLASDLISQKNKEKEATGKEQKYSMPYLLYRMAKINTGGRRKYLYGTIAAISESSYDSLRALCG